MCIVSCIWDSEAQRTEFKVQRRPQAANFKSCMYKMSLIHRPPRVTGYRHKGMGYASKGMVRGKRDSEELNLAQIKIYLKKRDRNILQTLYVFVIRIKKYVI